MFWNLKVDDVDVVLLKYPLRFLKHAALATAVVTCESNVAWPFGTRLSEFRLQDIDIVVVLVGDVDRTQGPKSESRVGLRYQEESEKGQNIQPRASSAAQCRIRERGKSPPAHLLELHFWQDLRTRPRRAGNTAMPKCQGLSTA